MCIHSFICFKILKHKQQIVFFDDFFIMYAEDKADKDEEEEKPKRRTLRKRSSGSNGNNSAPPPPPPPQLSAELSNPISSDPMGDMLSMPAPPLPPPHHEDLFARVSDTSNDGLRGVNSSRLLVPTLPPPTSHTHTQHISSSLDVDEADLGHIDTLIEDWLEPAGHTGTTPEKTRKK